MRKNSYQSRVANIRGAWSPSAISMTRGANSALYSPVLPKGQQQVVLKQSSVFAGLQSRYPEPIGGFTCVHAGPPPEACVNNDHSWKSLSPGRSANARCVCSESAGSFRIGHRGRVKLLAPCGSALETYRPSSPLKQFAPGPVSGQSFAWRDG
jgi:hypothetical protein